VPPRIVQGWQAGAEQEVPVIDKLVLAVAVAALVSPGAALAAKPKKGYAVGQKCTVKKEATYVAHKFMCVNGRLQVKK
jgi:hypothetical protein